MSPADTKRVIIQLEYMCDNNIVQQLQTGSSSEPTALMRWHDHMVQVQGVPGAASLQSLGNIITSTAKVVDSVAGAISGFLSSSSQSVQWIRRDGEFSRYEASTNSYLLQAVKHEDVGQAMSDIVTVDLPNAPPATLKHLRILMYGNMNTSSWTGQAVHFNQTTGGDATTVIAYATTRDDGFVDLAICTNSATFQVLGDLEVITTKKSYLGGLISGGSSVSMHAEPPAWTGNDTDALNEFMNVQCLNDLAVNHLKLPPVKLPNLPPAEVVTLP